MRWNWSLDMAQVITLFDDVIEGHNISYRPRAYGRPRLDGRWEGWLEFVPAGVDGAMLRTCRETVQPSRADLEFWARGLTRVFLEGALQRARARRPAEDDGPAARPVMPVVRTGRCWTPLRYTGRVTECYVRSFGPCRRCTSVRCCAPTR